MQGELRIVATADLGGLGSREGPPVLYTWGRIPFGLTPAFSPRLVPWLAILGLLLLNANRRREVWLVWIPLLAVAGLAMGIEQWLGFLDSELRDAVSLMVMALGFGWAAMLLLAPWAPWPRDLGRFGWQLLVLGLFGLLGLALGRDWGNENFMDIMSIVYPVLLQFVVFALAAALSFAGWFVRGRFGIPVFLKWFCFWLIVVWLLLAVPCVALASFGGRQASVAVLTLAACCSLASFVAALPFLVLATVSPMFRRRFQQLAVPSEPRSTASPAPTQ